MMKQMLLSGRISNKNLFYIHFSTIFAKNDFKKTPTLQTDSQPDKNETIVRKLNCDIHPTFFE